MENTIEKYLTEIYEKRDRKRGAEKKLNEAMKELDKEGIEFDLLICTDEEAIIYSNRTKIQYLILDRIQNRIAKILPLFCLSGETEKEAGEYIQQQGTKRTTHKQNKIYKKIYYTRLLNLLKRKN